ncbi:MAG: tetratricopeptide repeat protein [Gemmatimonadaceae bacterium]
MNRQALAALDAARPSIARLDRSRHSEELAADIIEAWGAVETAMRALIGGSPMAGQTLIREARQRQLITLDQAHALAEFHASRERVQETSYSPTENDINAAREGFLKLEASLMAPPPSDLPAQAPGEAMSTKGLRMSPLGEAQAVPPPGRQRWWIPAVAVLVVAVLAVGGWYLFARRDEASIARGVEYWQRGQRELAVAEFSRAARDDPESAIPHVYLSRMAREVGNMSLASQEATRAVQLEGTNAVALREMAAVMLASGNFELARRFYVRALQSNPDDRVSQGFMACTLIKLGRYDEAMRWMNRAGQGSWSSCAQGLASPGTMPPGTMPPGALPPPQPR